MKYQDTLEFLSIKQAHWESSTYYNRIIPPLKVLYFWKHKLEGKTNRHLSFKTVNEINYVRYSVNFI